MDVYMCGETLHREVEKILDQDRAGAELTESMAAVSGSRVCLSPSKRTH